MKEIIRYVLLNGNQMLKLSKNFELLEKFIQSIKNESLVLWFACQKKATPLTAKAIGFFVLAYAFSPIDLIPDFIPVIGILDDFVLLPVLITLAIKFLPKDIYHYSKAEAQAWVDGKQSKPKKILGYLLIPLLWIIVLYLTFRLWWH